jgi:hypothetical protein
MANTALLERLRSLGVPETVIAEVPELPRTVTGLLIYGSRARGDAVANSDLDLLALVPVQLPAINAGAVSVSFYTAAQLLTGISSLFGAHLKRDGKILRDDDGRLAVALEEMGQVDTARLFGRVRVMSELFTAPDRDLPKYLPGLLREARYLLRSSLYAQAIANGAPCFSVRELASRHGDLDLARLLASRRSDEPAVADYIACQSHLRELIGAFPESRHGSLEATVVNEWGGGSDLLSMAFMALGSSGGGSDYAEVEKILL